MSSHVLAIKGRKHPPWPSNRPEGPCAVKVKMGAKTSSHFIQKNHKSLGEDAAVILYICTYNFFFPLTAVLMPYNETARWKVE